MQCEGVFIANTNNTLDQAACMAELVFTVYKIVKASFLGHGLSRKAYMMLFVDSASLMLFVDSASIHWRLTKNKNQAFVESLCLMNVPLMNISK